MSKRQYYSVRIGKNPLATKLDLQTVLRLFRDLYLKFLQEGYFQESFGYYCVDAGDVPGTLGHDNEAQMFLALRKQGLWPISDKCMEYAEDDLFDVIEFLFDYVSKPVKGAYHNFNACGWHYYEFDSGAGRTQFRAEVNAFLPDYDEGFELSENGEVLLSGNVGLSFIFQAELSSDDPERIGARVQAAVLKFRRHRSSLEDRRDAVRDLADVLEFIRPKLKDVLHKKDESDLFLIVNRFGIRHHNEEQQTDYDKAVWYSWMFHYYLATIHAAQRLIAKHEPKE